MSGKNPTKLRLVLVILVVVFGVIGLRWAYHAFMFDQGTANSVSALQHVFTKAGPDIAASFTNSLIQNFPFDGNVDWKLGLIKDPMLSMVGNVNTSALPKFVSANPAIQFFWSGVDTNGKEWLSDEWPSADDYPTVTWKTMSFRTSNTASAVIEAKLNIASRRITYLVH